jgi:hypothetical protein
MEKPDYLRCLYRLALASAVLAVITGCRTNEPITSWDSPRLMKVQKEWMAIQEHARKMSEEERVRKYGDKDEGLYDLLDGIIEKQLSHEDMRQLAISCGALPIHSKDRSDFANAVLSSMVWVFINSGDRDSLVTLLSTRCPVQVGPGLDIEYYLPLHGEKKIKDPITVLEEAFSKCKSPEVRRKLAYSTRRAFRGHGITGKDDADFVKHAMEWYEKNKEHLTLNGGYFAYSQHSSEEMYERYPESNDKFPSWSDKKPLFLLPTR